MIPEYELQIKNGEMTLEEINQLRSQLSPTDWTYLRSLFNDCRFQQLQEQVKQINGELQLLYGNHLKSIEQNFQKLSMALSDLGIDKLDLSISHEHKK